MRIRIAVSALAILVSGSLVRAACPETCVPGGGPAKTDCLVEFDGLAPASADAKRLVCEDGDPTCDTDGSVNGSCRFLVRACFNVADPALPQCTPTDVASFSLKNPEPGKKGHDSQVAALIATVPEFPIVDAVCSDTVPVYLTLKGKKKFKAT